MCRGLAFDEHMLIARLARHVPHRIPLAHTAPAPRVTYTPALVINRYISGQATTGRPDRRIRYGCKFAAVPPLPQTRTPRPAA